MDHASVINNKVGKPGAGISASHTIFSSSDGKAYERCERTSAVHATEHVPPTIESGDGHSSKTERVKKMARRKKTQ